MMWVKRQQTLSYFSESFSAGFVPLFSIIYVSTVAQPVSDDDVLVILAESTDNNDAMGISGMLLYFDGVFMQVIEGSEESVRQLYSFIELDALHKDVILLLEEYIPERNFPEATMGYYRLTVDDLRSFDAAASISDAKQFISYFQRAPQQALPLLLRFRPA